MRAAYVNKPKPKHRKLCSACEATPQGCDSNYWLRASRCCSACAGDHDQATGSA